MKDKIAYSIDDAFRKARRKRLFKRVLALLAVMTLVSTSLYLRSPASTLEIDENENVGIINTEIVLDDMESPAEEGEGFYLSSSEVDEKQTVDAEDVEPAVKEAEVSDLVDVTEDWDEPENDVSTVEDNATDGSIPVDPIYDLNGTGSVLLSTVMASTYPEISVKNVTEAGESIIEDDQRLSIAVDAEDGDYRITVLRNFTDDDAAELVFYTSDGGVYLLDLKNGVKGELLSDGSAESASTEEESTDGEISTHSDAEDDLPSDETITSTAIERVDEGVDDGDFNIASDEENEIKNNTESELNTEADSETTREGMTASESDSNIEEGNHEDESESEQENTEMVDATEEEKDASAAEETKEDEDTSDTEETKEDEEAENAEIEEKTDGDNATQEDAANITPDREKSVICKVDLSGEKGPFSLLSWIESADPVEETALDIAREEADETEEDIINISADDSESPVETSAQDMAAPVRLPLADWKMEYDENILSVELLDEDYFVLPRASFIETLITVNTGDAVCAITLSNYSAPKELVDLGMAVVEPAGGEELPGETEGHAYQLSDTQANAAWNDIQAWLAAQKVKPAAKSAKKQNIREAIANVTQYQAFDISLDNVETEAYAEGFNVTVNLPQTVYGKNFALYHIHEDEIDGATIKSIERKDLTLDGYAAADGIEAVNSFSFWTDKFSTFVLSYTVDFEYNGYTYSIAGGTWVWLSDVLEELHTEFSVSDLVDVSFTDESLIAVEYVVGTEPETEGMFDWRLTSLLPFQSHELLTMTGANGEVYIINVTDDGESNNYHKDMNALLVPGTLKIYVDGEEVARDATVYVRDGMLYDLSFQLKEAGVNQFYNQNQDNPDHLYFQLPEGFILPEDYKDTLVINLGLDGKVYGNSLSYDKENNRLLLDWNKADRKYQRLIAAGNLRFTLHLSGYIAPGDVVYASEKLFTALRYDPHNASVAKTGSLDASDLEHQVITYTVKVMSDGSTENLTMTDVLGSALSYVMKDGVPDVTWARESTMSTMQSERRVETSQVRSATTQDAPYIRNTAEGFLITIPETHDGDVLTFTYKANVDYTKIASSGSATIDEMGNTVQIFGDSDPTDNKAVYHEKEIFFSDIAKDTEGPGPRYTEEDREYQNVPWSIVTNAAKVISFHGTQITDKLTEYDGNGVNEIDGVPLTYTGTGITIDVYKWDEHKLNRVFVEKRVIPWSALHVSDDLSAKDGWAYDVPDTDGAYEYDISYTTKADVTGLDSDVMLRNDAYSLGGNDRATTLLHPKGTGLGIKKRVIAYNEKEVTWEIIVTLDDIAKGFNDMLILTDCLPVKYDDRFVPYSPRRDTYKDGSLKIFGLQDGETYDVFYSEFKESSTSDKPGDGSAYLDWNARTNHRYTFKDKDGKATSPKEGGSNILFVRFYQDGNKTDGLKAPADGTDSRSLRIQLTTYNNPDWLKDMQTQKGIRGDYLLKHENNAYINASHELAEVMITGKQLFKKYDRMETWGWSDLNGLTGDDAIGFRFETYLGGVYPGEKVVIDDYFDTSLFKLVYRPASSPIFRAGSMPHYAGNAVWYVSNGDQYGTVLTETEYGFHVEINNPPTQADGSMYGAYGLDYVLIPRNADALSEIQRQVLEAGGIKNYINTATSGDLTDSDTFDVELLVRFKPVSKNIPTTEDVKNNMVEYTITLNPQKMMMNDGDFMTMEDTFENISIDYASIRISTEPEGREEEVSYDFSGNTGYYTIPDETKVVITYKARISPPEDTVWTQDGDAETADVEVANVASMLTWQDGGTNTLKVRRDAGADIYRIRAFKYGSGHMEEGLNGAVFGLYQDKLDGSGNPVQAKDENGSSIVDSWGNPVYEKEEVKRTKGDLAGQPIVFSTGDVWMLDGLIQSELTGMSAADVNALSNDELLSKLHGDYDDSNIAEARANLRDLSGYADVQLSDDADGVHLQDGKTYYLRELTEPDGYARDASVEYYAFRFGAEPKYVDGVWQYYNSDILKIRNSPTDGAFTVKKRLNGNYVLSDAQKDALRFKVYKKNGSSWEIVAVEVPVMDENGVQRTAQEGNYLYEYVTELTYDQMSGGVSVTHIGAGTFRVVESVADGGEGVPGSVTHAVSFTRDDIEDDMTEDGGEQYVQFEITDDDILNGLEHVFEITNTYTQETVTLRARKAWRDAEDNPVTPVGARVAFGVFRLVDDTIPEDAVPVQTVVLDGIPDVNSAALTGESSSWTAQFAKLPKLDDTGNKITYAVKEITGISGYEAEYGNENSYLVFVDGEDIIVPTITNKQETVEYAVEKRWTKPYWEGESWIAPSGIKLGVYYGATEAEAYAKYAAGQRAYREIALPIDGAASDEAWKATFTGLPKADGTGGEYQWIAVETASVAGFVAEYPDSRDYLPLTGHNGEALIVTNRVEGVDVGFTKAWQRTLNNEWPENQAIDVTLARTLKYDGGEASDDAFTAVYTIIRTGDGLSAVLKTGEVPTDWNKEAVTPIVSIDEKTGRASFTLKGLPRYGTVDTHSGEWEYRFAESELSDYATTYSTGAGLAYALNGGVITNTRKDEEISFKKTWIGEDGQSESWAEGTTITVRRTRGFKYLDGDEEVKETVSTVDYRIQKTSTGFEITPNPGLTYDEEKERFTGGTYPRYGVRSGHAGEYIFTWEETAVTDANGDELSYVPIVNPDATDAGQTNIVNMKLKTVDVEVRKTWLDGEAAVPDALKAPVRVRLYHKVDAPSDGDGHIEVNSSCYVPVTRDATGAAIDVIELSGDNGWTATAPLLSKYVSKEADAAEEVYIFREEAVYLDGAWSSDVGRYYEVTYTDTAAAPGGTVINNKPKDTLTKTSVTFRKVWNDTKDHSADKALIRLYSYVEPDASQKVAFNITTKWYYKGGEIPFPNASNYGSGYWSWPKIENNDVTNSQNLAPKVPGYRIYAGGDGSFWFNYSESTFKDRVGALSVSRVYNPSQTNFRLSEQHGNVDVAVVVEMNIEAPSYTPGTAWRFVPETSGTWSQHASPVIIDGAVKEIELKNGNTNGDFGMLPRYDELGNEIHYLVKEEWVEVDAAGDRVSYTHTGDSWTITNTAEYDEPTTDFEFTKVWYDNDGEEVGWQGNISVTLYSSTDQGEDTEVASFNLTSDGGTSGAYTWSAEAIQEAGINRTKFKIEGLPTKSDDATLVYYVTEAGAAGYKEPVYGTSAGAGSNVITPKEDTKAENGQYIQNRPDDAYELPSTGGPGTTLYTLTGISLILLAVALLLRKRQY